ncbi:hypothetical protein JCM19992_27370 [Thermostilla marina]
MKKLSNATYFSACCILLLAGASANAEPAWQPLFDGKSFEGWKAAEHPESWTIENGCLVAHGPRSHLFYAGPVGNHRFKNFELRVTAKTAPHSNSGVYFHTEYQESGWPEKGYEVQINNGHSGSENYVELKQTGSLYAVQNLYKNFVPNDRWFTMRVRVVVPRVQIWVNDILCVDYVEPADPIRRARMTGRRLGTGTIALQGHDPGSRVAFRAVEIRLLPDDADPFAEPRPDTAPYGITENVIDKFGAGFIPVIDFHVHLRGGMTAEKAVQRQAVTGVNVGVLRNVGKGWPIETNEQLREFLDSVEGLPVFVGVQVNDRDWMTHFDKKLLDRLDYVLGDTMIMPMPDDDSQPVKLWMPELYTIEDPEAWMERYMAHNLRVVSEPITILANPTYLPPPVEHLYDELWTDARMKRLIEAAVANNVAFEINARSGLPHDRFIRLAKSMGAKFTLGTNNFDDKPIDMSRCFEVIEKFQLGKDDMYVPKPKH